MAGHSLGGGLAHVFAADISFNQPLLRNVTKIYTIAAPYTGNKAFCDLINSKNSSPNYSGIFNIINNNDYVPTIKELFYKRLNVQTFCFSNPGNGSLGSWHFVSTYIKGIQDSKFDECAKVSSSCGIACA